MKVMYKQKPSQELVEKYLRTIEKLLSVHEVRLELEICDEARGPLVSYVNSIMTSEIYFWLGDMKLKSEKFGEMEIFPPRQGLEEKELTEHAIWNDAVYIQNVLYNKVHPFNLSLEDPYWKLWDHLPKN